MLLFALPKLDSSFLVWHSAQRYSLLCHSIHLSKYAISVFYMCTMTQYGELLKMHKYWTKHTHFGSTDRREYKLASIICHTGTVARAGHFWADLIYSVDVWQVNGCLFLHVKCSDAGITIDKDNNRTVINRWPVEKCPNTGQNILILVVQTGETESFYQSIS